MKNEKIDLHSIAQILLSDNAKIKEYVANSDNFNKALSISGEKLSAKYPDLSFFDDTSLISFFPTDKGININIPFLANYDGDCRLFGVDNKILDYGYEIKDYKLDLVLPSANIIINDEVSLTIKVKINDTAKSKISKEDTIIGTKNININYLHEITIFTPIKELKLGKYKLVKNTKKYTKDFKDLLVHLECIETKELFKYVAINEDVNKLISKYGKDTKFEIIGHQKFVNDDGKNAVKTIIKDLNFKEDLSDLDLF